MDMEENGNDLIKVLAHFPQRTNKHKKTGVPAKIQTRHLPNGSLKCITVTSAC